MLSSYRCAVVQSCFIAALTHFFFSGFLRPQETKCPSFLFLLHLRWRWTLELHSPEALGILCLPQHKGEQCLAPHPAFMVENGRCWTPSSSLCALCVFLPLLLGYKELETCLFLGKSFLKWRSLAFVQEVLWQWQVWVWVFWFANSLLWAMASILPEALPWEEMQFSFDPEMCYWNSRETLAWPQALGKLCQEPGESGPPSHCCQLPCPQCAGLG